MPYPLITERLIVEPLAAPDVEAFTAYRRDPRVARWQSWETTYSVADARRLVADQPATDLPGPGGWIQLAVRDRGRTVLHGDVAIHSLAGQLDGYELGVTLAPPSQRQGIGTEAVAAVLGLLFEQAGAYRVIAFCDTRNEPVARLLRRVGMRREAREREAVFLKGEWTSVDGYVLPASEYRPDGRAPV